VQSEECKMKEPNELASFGEAGSQLTAQELLDI